MQRRIGLTGSIPSGKSSVSKLLMPRGWPVLDADLFAKQLLEPGTGTTQAVLQRHPGVRLEHDNIDRTALGRIIFSDSS